MGASSELSFPLGASGFVSEGTSSVGGGVGSPESGGGVGGVSLALSSFESCGGGVGGVSLAFSSFESCGGGVGGVSPAFSSFESCGGGVGGVSPAFSSFEPGGGGVGGASLGVGVGVADGGLDFTMYPLSQFQPHFTSFQPLVTRLGSPSWLV